MQLLRLSELLNRHELSLQAGQDVLRKPRGLHCQGPRAASQISCAKPVSTRTWQRLKTASGFHQLFDRCPAVPRDAGIVASSAVETSQYSFDTVTLPTQPLPCEELLIEAQEVARGSKAINVAALSMNRIFNGLVQLCFAVLSDRAASVE